MIMRAALFVLAGGRAASARPPTPRSRPVRPGSGDPFFPYAGNGGYDVAPLRPDAGLRPPATPQLDGRAAITATATQDLSRLNLDLRGFDVSSVTVGGRVARFAARRAGARDHAGAADPQRDASSRSASPTRASRRSSPTRTARSRAGSRPTTARSSSTNRRARPGGTRPTTTRATRRRSTSPSPSPRPDRDGQRRAVSHGRPAAAGRRGCGASSDPMATYLATTTLGRFDLAISTVAGVPSYVAVDPQLAKGQVLSKLPAMVDFYGSIYGPYPFDASARSSTTRRSSATRSRRRPSPTSRTCPTS